MFSSFVCRFSRTLCSLSVPGKQEWAELHAVLRTEIMGKSTCLDSLQWLFSVTFYLKDYPFCCNGWNFILFDDSVIILLKIYKHAAKSLQLCPTLCDPIDRSPPGSPVPGILQARTLEWVAISFSKVWKWKVKVKSLSRVQPSATPWTAAFQAPPSMGFSRQESWSGVPLPSPCMYAAAAAAKSLQS